MKRLMAAASGLLIACAAVAQNAPPAAGGGGGDSGAYRINPGDILDIYVWGDERLQRALSVLPDGSFAFPLAGTVHAAGM